MCLVSKETTIITTTTTMMGDNHHSKAFEADYGRYTMINNNNSILYFCTYKEVAVLNSIHCNNE